MSRVADTERGRQWMHLRSHQDVEAMKEHSHKYAIRRTKGALSQRLLQQYIMGRKKSEYAPRL